MDDLVSPVRVELPQVSYKEDFGQPDASNDLHHRGLDCGFVLISAPAG